MGKNNNGLNISTIITIIFVVLKLIGKITWSWWWVLSPIWIGWSVAAILMVILVLLGKK